MAEKFLWRKSVTMASIIFHVEGQTEERFIERIVSPYFISHGYKIKTIIICTKPGCFGGLTNYKQFKSNTLRLISQNPECYITTMIDLFGLPDNFPGVREYQSENDSLQKVHFLETKLLEDIDSERFIPYIQLHEFEALLFSSIDVIDDQLAEFNEGSKFDSLKTIMDVYESPENINQSTGPAARLENLYGNYKKTTDGLTIADKIGLGKMRSQCFHFNEWMTKLETLDK